MLQHIPLVFILLPQQNKNLAFFALCHKHGPQHRFSVLGVEYRASSSTGMKVVDITLNICILDNCCIVCHTTCYSSDKSVLLLIRYLRSTTCVLLQSSLNFEKHSENFSWTENRYEANRRRHNSSDGFDPNIGRPNGGITYLSWNILNTSISLHCSPLTRKIILS